MEHPPENSHWIRTHAIGKGSFATVSLAVDKSDGRIFAVKSVDKNSALPAQLDALENEIEILQSLSSPHVVACSGDDTTQLLAPAPAVCRNLHLEYLPGGTAAKLASSGADVEEIRAYTWCIVTALRYVHSQGIVHCDVKGRNILLGSTPGVAKLADFGSSMRNTIGRSRIVPRGSPLWMAPEVVRGESQGFESDVWSLGCTVIEMLTGMPAWQDEGPHTLRRIGYSDELPEVPVGMSKLGVDFLEKCLRREPRQRWSCDQLLQHPFLIPVPAHQMTDTSPRSVLGWPISDYSDEENEFGLAHLDTAKERVGELATTSGVNWESDGWVEVRGNSIIRTDSKHQTLVRGKIETDASDHNSSTWMHLWTDDDQEVFDGRCGGSSDGGSCSTSGDGGKRTIMYSVDLLFLLLLSITSLASIDNQKNMLFSYDLTSSKSTCILFNFSEYN